MKITAKPVEGRRVRKQDGEPLEAKGEPVDDAPYWRRREADGDVTIGAAPKGGQ